MMQKGKIGLVLGGGGAKGAYQAGVIKALSEYKILNKVSHISGTSIGALNLVTLVGEGYKKNLSLWEKIEISDALTKQNLGQILTKKSFFSREGFIELVNKEIDLEKVSKSKIKSFVVVTPERNKIGKAKTTFQLNGLDKDKILKVILASSAIPIVFETVNIDGTKYTDGAGIDNVPVSVLKKQGCTTIFAIPLRKDSPCINDVDKNTVIIDFVSPYNDYLWTDGTLDFHADSSKIRINHGYQVAKQLIEKLIKEGVLVLNFNHKIKKTFKRVFRRKKISKENYYCLDPKEIKHIPETHLEQKKLTFFQKIEKLIKDKVESRKR